MKTDRRSLRIVADDKIPYLQGQAERMGTVSYLPGAAISQADVADADVLIVRTRTRCDRALLEGAGCVSWLRPQSAMTTLTLTIWLRPA